MQMLEISLLIFGSLEPTYFDMDEEDGYKRLRYVWLKEVLKQLGLFSRRQADISLFGNEYSLWECLS